MQYSLFINVLPVEVAVVVYGASVTVTIPALAGLTSKFAPKLIVAATPITLPSFLILIPVMELDETLINPDPSP